MFPSQDHRTAEFYLDDLIREAAEERLGRRITNENKSRRGFLAPLGLRRR